MNQMRFGFIRTLALAALLILPATAFAQFGHPFNGAYSGGWGKDQANRVLFNTEWNGKAVTGTVTSAGDKLNIASSDFDYSNPEAWKVTFKLEGKDAAGKAINATVAGTLENVGVYYKIFRGTWTQGAEKHDFVVTRN